MKIRTLTVFLISAIPFISSCDGWINNESNTALGDGILDLNPPNVVIPKLNNLKTGFTDYGTLGNNPPVVAFLHFSDLHGNNTNLLRIEEFANEYKDYIDDVLQTGDLVPGVITDGTPADWSNVPSWLSVIGNHDATIKINNVWTTVSSKESYSILFAPYINYWGVVQPPNATVGDFYPCYYYKDYPPSYLRLIVLDNMQSMNNGPTHWDSTQKEWFEDTLSDAIKKGLHVVVALHYPPFATEHNPNIPFDSITVHPDEAYWHASKEIPNAVKMFIDAGGKFVCYLSGHTHCDYFGVAKDNSDWSNQLCIGVASASHIAGSGIYGDCDRTLGTKGQDCFNIVGIDTASYVIKLVRIGCEYDKLMRRKDTLCWNYRENKLIYVN